MRITQAGLRSGFPITRFAAPLSNSRESHLGLRRRLAPQITSHTASNTRAPLLAALRSAARGTAASSSARPEDDAPRTTAVASLRRSDSMTWAQAANGHAHRPRSRSAAPWRG